MHRALPVAFALALVACGPHTVIRTTSAGGGISADQTVGATADADQTPGADATGTAPRAWLWRVSGGDAVAPSYVLGTMHVGIRMEDALPPPHDAFLHDARTLVMEVDFREAQRFVAESARTHRGTRSGRGLDRALGRESWERLRAEMGQILPDAILRRVPPGTMTLYLQQVRLAEVEAIEEGREPVPGAASSARLDESIADWAIRAGVPIVALETPEQALAALDALPETDVVAQLHQIVDDRDGSRGEASALRDAYLAFDETSLDHWISEQMPAPVHDALITQRNRAWEAALFPQIQQGNAFVAVGVAHLIGEGSVIESLRAHGYTVERLGAPTP